MSAAHSLHRDYAPRRADAARALVAAITDILCPVAIEVIATTSVDWVSATFAGARHELTLRIAADHAAIAAQIAGIATYEFSIGGHLVADIVADARAEIGAVVLTIEALTIETA